jgi:hypothetical protein
MIGNPIAAEVANSVLTQCINWAYRDIASRYPHIVVRPRANFNTVSGTATYNLPSPFSNTEGVIHQVWDRTNRVQLERLGERRASEQDSEGVASPLRARPTAYAHWSDGLQLYPTPDAVYSIQVIGKRTVADLSAGGDTTLLSSVWDMGILLWSEWHYYNAIKKDIPKAQQAFNTFKIWMADRPLEANEEKYAMDSGVELPTLGRGLDRGYDWDHED